jgi:hypothetical protein
LLASAEEVEQETVVVVLVEVQRQTPVPEVAEPDQPGNKQTKAAALVDLVSFIWWFRFREQLRFLPLRCRPLSHRIQVPRTESSVHGSTEVLGPLPIPA